jgi:SAM-dependent methyltransferase
MAERCQSVVGIDLSGESIALAQARTPSMPNLRFFATSLEAFASRTEERFSIIVANMMLMTTPDLTAALKAIAFLLKSDGRFVFTIPHPCFWPTYWEYDREEWFDYNKEIAIEAPFAISSEGPSQFITTHVHRPLEQYFSVLTNSGLTVQRLIEPRPPDRLNPEYLGTWHFPRFLLMACSKSCSDAQVNAVRYVVETD